MTKTQASCVHWNERRGARRVTGVGGSRAVCRRPSLDHPARLRYPPPPCLATGQKPELVFHWVLPIENTFQTRVLGLGSLNLWPLEPRCRQLRL